MKNVGQTVQKYGNCEMYLYFFHFLKMHFYFSILYALTYILRVLNNVRHRLSLIDEFQGTVGARIQCVHIIAARRTADRSIAP